MNDSKGIAISENFMIAIDANEGYTVAQALELGERIEDLNIIWFEEPSVGAMTSAGCVM